MKPKAHVSEVIRPWLDPTWWTAESRDRGLRVHASCGAWINGTWAPKLPEDEQGYFDSFLRWADQFLVRIIPFAVEIPIEDDDLGFIGTPDFVDSVSVFDWKTPVTKYAAWKVAGSAYFHLAKKKGWPVKRVGNLQLRKDGKMAKMEWIKNPEEIFPVFLSCLNAFRYMNQGAK